MANKSFKVITLGCKVNQYESAYLKEALAAILNKEEGELMKHRNLIAIPKYRTIWKTVYGKEIG